MISRVFRRLKAGLHTTLSADQTDTTIGPGRISRGCPTSTVFVEQLENRLMMSHTGVPVLELDVGSTTQQSLLAIEEGGTVPDDPNFGADVMPSARWDVIPYQTFDSTFEIGVVAFHIVDIDRVEFTINGSLVLTADDMTLNPRTGVVEYWVGLDAADYADGAITIAATAYPTVGLPRVLEPLTLYADDGHTLASYVVELEAGTHLYPDQTQLDLITGGDKSQWVTFRPAPGVSSEDVRVIVGGKPRDYKVHLQDVTIEITDLENDNVIRGTGDSAAWLDGCHVVGLGHTLTQNQAARSITKFWTGCTVTDVRVGYLASAIVRDSSVLLAGEDGFKDVDLIVNSEIVQLVKGQPEWHGDSWQHGTGDNVIVYGVETRDHNIHIVNTTEAAFVNVIAFPTDGADTMQLIGNVKNTIFKDLVLHEQIILREDIAFVPENMILEDVLFLNPTRLTTDDFPSMYYRWTPEFLGQLLVGVGSLNATEIADDKYLIHGDLIIQHDLPTELFVVWGTTNGGANLEAWQNVKSLGEISDPSYSTILIDLDEGQEYFASAYTVNEVGTSWFHTPAQFVTEAIHPLLDPDISLNMDGGLSTILDKPTDAFWVGNENFDVGVNGSATVFSGHTVASGLGNLIMIPNDGFFDGREAFTVSLWAKKAQSDESQVILSTGGAIKLEVTANRVKVHLQTTLGFLQVSFAAPVNNTSWHHIALTYDGTQAYAYVDREQVWSLPFPGGPMVDLSHDFIVVGGDPFDRSFNGAIDDLRIYNFALDQSQVSFIAPAPSASSDQSGSTEQNVETSGAFLASPAGRESMNKRFRERVASSRARRARLRLDTNTSKSGLVQKVDQSRLRIRQQHTIAASPTRMSRWSTTSSVPTIATVNTSQGTYRLTQLVDVDRVDTLNQ